jgi:hypothetical protein
MQFTHHRTRHRLLNTKESASFPASVSRPLLSLLNTLLQRNPDLRCKSWTQVKQHEFFQVVCYLLSCPFPALMRSLTGPSAHRFREADREEN